MAVGKAITYLLENASGVTDIVGTKIYPDTAPQQVTFPYVVYQEINTSPSDDKDGTSRLDVVRVQVDLYTQNYDTCETLAAAVRAALDRQTGTINTVTIDSIKFSNEVSGSYNIDMNVWWRSQDYDIRLRR